MWINCDGRTAPTRRGSRRPPVADGVEVAGGVVVARYGSNPMIVIENIKEKIEQISPGLPSRELDDGTISKLTIVPFYDRSGLIRETLSTLEEALSLEVIITIIVIIIMVRNLRGGLVQVLRRRAAQRGRST